MKLISNFLLDPYSPVQLGFGFYIFKYISQSLKNYVQFSLKENFKLQINLYILTHEFMVDREQRKGGVERAK